MRNAKIKMKNFNLHKILYGGIQNLVARENTIFYGIIIRKEKKNENFMHNYLICFLKKTTIILL